MCTQPHTCVVVLSSDSLIVKYVDIVCLSYSLSECSEATQTCLPEEVSFQVRSLLRACAAVLVVTNSVC